MQLVWIESRIRISERKAWTAFPVCSECHRCWTSIERVQWADISPTCVNRSWFVEEAREIGRNVRSSNLLSFDCSTLVARTDTHRVIRRIIDNRSTNKLCMRWTRESSLPLLFTASFSITTDSHSDITWRSRFSLKLKRTYVLNRPFFYRLIVTGRISSWYFYLFEGQNNSLAVCCEKMLKFVMVIIF